MVTSTNSLVIGASGGIGLALTTKLLQREGSGTVFATHRRPETPRDLVQLKEQFPDRLTLLHLETTDQESISRFSQAIRKASFQPGLTVHTAGILHEQGIHPEKSLDQCDPEALMRYFQVNSVAPLMVARELLPGYSRSSKFTWCVLSAMVGSIGDNRRGGWYGYRASKAALNQFVRTLARECRMRYPNGCVLALHPGTTDTNLSKPFQRNIQRSKLYTAGQTAERILDVLGNVTPKSSGLFLNWDGTEIPW